MRDISRLCFFFLREVSVGLMKQGWYALRECEVFVCMKERTSVMQEVTFDLQTITPLFLAGGNYNPTPPQRPQGRERFAAEGKDLQAELRPASFRGLMRYWLRTVTNGLSVDLNDIVQLEKDVFGTTDHSSSMHLRITQTSKKPERFKKENSYPDITGRDYLLWSMAASGRGERHKPDRWYFPEGTKFSITLSERIAASAVPQALPLGIASLWLLTALGGIGSRSHRCAGSIAASINPISTGSIAGNLPFLEAASPEELQMILQQGLRETRKLFSGHFQKLGVSKSSTSTTYAPFDSLLLPRADSSIPTPHYCRIWLLTQNNRSPWQSFQKAMNAIGTELQEYRSSLGALKRATFGLPLIMRLPNREEEKALKENRRTSPLLLRITKLRNDSCVGVAVLFKTPIEPITDSGGKRVLIPAPDYTLIEKWITETFPHSLEVKI